MRKALHLASTDANRGEKKIDKEKEKRKDAAEKSEKRNDKNKSRREIKDFKGVKREESDDKPDKSVVSCEQDVRRI